MLTSAQRLENTLCEIRSGVHPEVDSCQLLQEFGRRRSSLTAELEEKYEDINDLHTQIEVRNLSSRSRFIICLRIEGVGCRCRVERSGWRVGGGGCRV